MLSAEKIQDNWGTYLNIIKNRVGKDRSQPIIDFHMEHEERFMMMPASSKDWFHSAFPGGYIDHVIRVVNNALKLYSVWEDAGGDMSTYTEEELVFAALFHDLGKMGLPGDNQHFYEPNDSQWHIDKLGMTYKCNTEIPAMKVPERSLFILQQLGVKTSVNEFLGIKLHDGLYDDSNKFYLMSGMKETRLRTHMPILLHQADQMAAQIEFEIWNNSTDSIPKVSKKQYKPRNASKADKTLRTTEAMKKSAEDLNPNFKDTTINLIDSFFKTEK
tara:strand:- start:1732 stop:2550 length:819 start_codon:yes stop_codon:yes gene_type:complete